MEDSLRDSESSKQTISQSIKRGLVINYLSLKRLNCWLVRLFNNHIIYLCMIFYYEGKEWKHYIYLILSFFLHPNVIILYLKSVMILCIITLSISVYCHLKSF